MAHQDSPVTLHWAPECYISPCFQHYQPDGALVQCLTKTQVALHEKNLLCAELLKKAAADKDEWERQQRLMMEQLRAMQVRNAEAERLFKHKEQQLGSRLKGTANALDELSHDHQQLQNASAEQLRYLQHQLAQLQVTCADMQAERAQLQAQLQDAQLTKAALQQAAQRIAQLEAGIAATQARAQQMLDKVQKERDAMKATNDQLQGELTDTMRALADQLERKQAAEQQSKMLVVQTQQLSHALNLERMINEPLRHTNHMSTTVAHVMRSAANTMVEDRAHVPLSSSHVGTTTYVLSEVQQPQQMFAATSQPSLPQQQCQPQPQQPQAFVPLVPQDATLQSSMPNAQGKLAAGAMSASAGLAAGGSGAQQSFEASSTVALPSPTPNGNFMDADQQPFPAATAVSGPVIATLLSPAADKGRGRRSPRQGSLVTTVHSIGGDALKRLGRAWATTTPTAGHPVAEFQDNISRFASIYKDAMDAATPKDKARSQSAGPLRRAVPVQPPLSAVNLEARLQTAEGKTQSRKPSMAAPRKASATLVNTYYDMRGSGGKQKAGSPAGTIASKRGVAGSMRSSYGSMTTIPAVYRISSSSIGSSDATFSFP